MIPAMREHEIRHDHAGRLARAGDEARRAGLDGVLVGPSSDLIFLAGYDAPVLERLTLLVIRPGHDPVLVVPRLERPRAQASPAGSLLEMKSWPDGDDPYALVASMLPSDGLLGASDHMWALHLLALQRTLPSALFSVASSVLSPLRIRKDPGEVELLARSGRAADETFGRICGEGLGGRPEREVSRSLADGLMANGCESAAFGIVGSGPNGASPHHEAGDRVIQPGDAVVLDYGGRFGGYCSDMTRTVSVGEPPAEVKEIHAVVREAQEAAFRAVRPGVPAQEIDRAARGVIQEAGYGDRFIHRTGHGIGLDEHETPYIVEGADERLERGMCFSIEPGIYLEGRFGVRIEDIVTVTQDGARRLNEAPRDLIVVQ
jgi:Xaa-Pro aminopeptidase